MLGANHRVISDTDFTDEPLGQQQQQQQQPQQQQQMQELNANTGVHPQTGSVLQPLASFPVVVEPEEEGDCLEIEEAAKHRHSDVAGSGAPFVVKAGSPTFTSGSSLSDNSMNHHPHPDQDGDIRMEDAEDEDNRKGTDNHPRRATNMPPPRHEQQEGKTISVVVGGPAPAKPRMERSDSKTSDESGGSGSGDRASTATQNSSRDWGWFEDVHYGSDQNLAKHSSPPIMGKIRRSLKISKRPLVPHADVVSGPGSSQPEIIPQRDESAAAMAVTAPTYVLEESLSSQRLWKDTAGNRPPQPVEERAFYEKMWSQNFVRSKVNYAMPVEVLTATSPISLSPFADGLMETDTNMLLESYDVYSNNSRMDGTTGESGAEGTDPPTKVGVSQGSSEAVMFWNSQQKNKYMDNDSGSWEPYRHQYPVNKTVKDTNDGEYLTVMVRGDNVFGTTVSKSFARTTDPPGIDTVNISIASYRVVESKKHGKYAQFLVIYREGSIRDTVGVWKRYSDFCELSRKVTQAHEGCASVIANMSPLSVTEEHDIEHLPNAITSWRLLKKRQRWYRCLDAGYLSLKVFLLERFLHDILFESSSPKLLREFVGASAFNALQQQQQSSESTNSTRSQTGGGVAATGSSDNSIMASSMSTSKNTHMSVTQRR